jgi:hypothetical protein
MFHKSAIERVKKSPLAAPLQLCNTMYNLV